MPSQTLDTQKAVKAAREVAPISNWVKPSKSDVTLPTPMRPTFERMSYLERQLENERREKIALQNQLQSAIRRMDALKDRLASLSKEARA